MTSHVCVRIFSAANELSQAHRGDFIPKGQLSKATGTRMSVRPASTKQLFISWSPTIQFTRCMSVITNHLLSKVQ